MEPIELDVHSFIVKIWCEWTGKRSPSAIWRGHITHVPDSERRYLSDLDDIAIFILPYIERMGVRIPVRWRIRQWLNRWKQQIWRSQ